MKNATKTAIKILQGSAVTQHALAEFIIHSLFATSPWCTYAKTYKNRLTNIKVMNEDKVGPFYRDTM